MRSEFPYTAINTKVEGRALCLLFPKTVSRPEAKGLEDSPVIAIKLGRCVLQPTLGNELEGSVEISRVSMSCPQIHSETCVRWHDSSGYDGAVARRCTEEGVRSGRIQSQPLFENGVEIFVLLQADMDKIRLRRKVGPDDGC